MADLSQLTREIEIPWADGDTLKVRYSRRAMNSRTMRRLQHLSRQATNEDGAEPDDAQAEAVERELMELWASVLKSWDLTDDGKPVPLNVKTLQETLDIFTLGDILNKVQEDMVPNSTGTVTN